MKTLFDEEESWPRNSFSIDPRSEAAAAVSWVQFRESPADRGWRERAIAAMRQAQWPALWRRNA